MDASMAEMRAVSSAAIQGALMGAPIGGRSHAEFTSARVVHNGPDRRLPGRPQHDEIMPLLSVVSEVSTKQGTIKVWELRDSRTSHSITCITDRDDLEFAQRYLAQRNERITATQSFYDWNQA